MLLDSLKKTAKTKLKLFTELAHLAYTNFKENAERTKIEMMLPDPEPPYLKNRVVWCPDCSGKRQLTVRGGTHVVVCDQCNGSNWVYFTNKYFFEQSHV